MQIATPILPQKIRDSYVHSSASRRDTVGSRPCKIPRCMTYITSSTTFTSTITRKTYSILYNLSGQSHNVIYFITCSLCSKQYVGLTSQALRTRFNTHRFNINNDRGDAVDKHFNSTGTPRKDHTNGPANSRCEANKTKKHSGYTHYTRLNLKVSTSTTKQPFQSHKSINTPNFPGQPGATLDIQHS